MESEIDDFTRGLAKLRERLSGLGGRLAAAARNLQEAGTLPADDLLDELAAARADFTELRADVFAAARTWSVRVSAQSDIAGVRALDELIGAVREAVTADKRRREIEDARRRALEMLDRVLAIAHQDDPKLAALVQCKTRAEEIRRIVSDPAAFDDGDPEAIIESTPAFTALLGLVEDHDRLDDERFAALSDTVTQSFGRQLAVAATRGKLFIAGRGTPAAAPATEVTPPPRTRTAPRTLDELAEGLAHEAVKPAASVASATSRQPAVAPSPALKEPVPEVPDETLTESPHAVDESVRWWVSAWARWTSWKGTLSFRDAVRQEVGKYPYLLSVPLQKSADYEDGLLAYGYSILLDYLEQQSPGIITKAVSSLKTVTPGHAKTVGSHMYDFLLGEGRLGERYPEFIRRVFVAAVPEPGVWTTARVLESTAETRVFTHPSARIGDTEHNSQRLTHDRQRFVDHRFAVVLAPLMTRCFAIAAEIREARSVEIKLVEGSSEADNAWLLTVPPAGRANLKTELLRLAPEGTTLPGLGKEYATLWLAVFNADPHAEKRYELSLGLRKEARPPAGLRPVPIG